MLRILIESPFTDWLRQYGFYLALGWAALIILIILILLIFSKKKDH